MCTSFGEECTQVLVNTPLWSKWKSIVVRFRNSMHISRFNPHSSKEHFLGNQFIRMTAICNLSFSLHFSFQSQITCFTFGKVVFSLVDNPAWTFGTFLCVDLAHTKESTLSNTHLIQYSKQWLLKGKATMGSTLSIYNIIELMRIFLGHGAVQ